MTNFPSRRIGPAAAGNVYQVASVHSAMTGEARKLMDEFKAKFNEDWYPSATYHSIALLSASMAKARSTDPVKVAFAMEGMGIKSISGDIQTALGYQNFFIWGLLCAIPVLVLSRFVHLQSGAQPVPAPSGQPAEA